MEKIPLDLSRLTKEELDAELEKGYVEISEGKTISAKKFFDELYEEPGI